jgi:hypothetical protein
MRLSDDFWKSRYGGKEPREKVFKTKGEKREEKVRETRLQREEKGGEGSCEGKAERAGMESPHITTK